LNRGWRFCRLLRVVDVVVPPRLLVSGRRWFWSVLGHSRTQIGRKFLVRLEGLVAFERRGDRYPVTSPPTNRTFSLLAPQTLDPIWDSFMKRLCQVTRLVEAAPVFINRPPVSAHSPRTQPRGMGARTGHTSSASSSSVVPHLAGGEVVHPFMRALDGTVRAGRTIRIRRRSRAVYGTALRSGHLSQRADSSSLTTSYSLAVHS